MSGKSTAVLPWLRGTAEYDRWLGRVMTRIGIDSRTDLVDLAMRRLGESIDMPAPPRALPHGTNRFGQPGTRKDR